MSNIIENTYFPIINKEEFDLVVYNCGMEKCESKDSFGPAVRDHFLIHYILEGQGSFYIDDKCYELNKNQGFLICPDIITYYQADEKNPWSYTWIGFKGLKAERYLKKAGLDRNNPIFNYENEEFIYNCFEEIRKSASMKYGAALQSQGLLSIFLSELIEHGKNNIIDTSNYIELYIRKSLQYIETNYSREISIAEIAHHVGLNKNYFSSIIKKQLGITLQGYLIKFRMNKACELLSNKILSIGDIARSVGYNDPLVFSKTFKKVKGVSPKEYRQRII